MPVVDTICSRAGAAHATFADGGCIVNAGADLLCGRGRDSRAQAAALTSTQALAWVWQQLVGEQQVGGGDIKAAACDSRQRLCGKHPASALLNCPPRAQ